MKIMINRLKLKKKKNTRNKFPRVIPDYALNYFSVRLQRRL